MAFHELLVEVEMKMSQLEVRCKEFAKNEVVDSAHRMGKMVVRDEIRVAVLSSEQRIRSLIEKEKKEARDRTVEMVIQGTEIAREELDLGARLELVIPGPFSLEKCILCEDGVPKYAAGCGHKHFCATCILKHIGTERAPNTKIKCPSCLFECDRFHFLG